MGIIPPLQKAYKEETCDNVDEVGWRIPLKERPDLKKDRHVGKEGPLRERPLKGGSLENRDGSSPAGVDFVDTAPHDLLDAPLKLSSWQHDDARTAQTLDAKIHPCAQDLPAVFPARVCLPESHDVP